MFEVITFWHWLVLALLLLILEVTANIGWFLWLGIAAVATAVIAWLLPNLVWEAQLFIFCVISLLNTVFWWFFLRKKPIKTDRPTLNRRAEQYVGQKITLKSPIRDGIGQVTLADTIWAVKAEHDIDSGEKVEVYSVDGTVLQVRHIKSFGEKDSSN